MSDYYLKRDKIGRLYDVIYSCNNNSVVHTISMCNRRQSFGLHMVNGLIIMRQCNTFSTGYENLDSFLGGGIQRGDILSILGGSRVKNSALATNIAYNLAYQDMIDPTVRCPNVVYVSLNDHFANLMVRIVSAQSSFTGKHIVNSWAYNPEPNFMGGFETRRKILEKTGYQANRKFHDFLMEKIGPIKTTEHLFRIAELAKIVWSGKLNLLGIENEYVRSLKKLDFHKGKDAFVAKLRQLTKGAYDVIVFDYCHRMGCLSSDHDRNVERVIMVLQDEVTEQEKILITVPQHYNNDDEPIIIPVLEQVSNKVINLGNSVIEQDEQFEKVSISIFKAAESGQKNCTLRYNNAINRFLNNQGTNGAGSEVKKFGIWNIENSPIKSEIYSKLSGDYDKMYSDFEIEKNVSHYCVSTNK